MSEELEREMIKTLRLVRFCLNWYLVLPIALTICAVIGVLVFFGILLTSS